MSHARLRENSRKTTYLGIIYPFSAAMMRDDIMCKYSFNNICNTALHRLN